MRRLLEIPEYVEDVTRVASLDLPWSRLAGRTVAITGATGLIGSFLVDVLHARAKAGDRLNVLMLGRSQEKACRRFGEYWNDGLIRFVEWDADPAKTDAGLVLPQSVEVDYILHLASNTHPVAYATDPIGTIATNVIALNGLLNWASHRKSHKVNAGPRFLFASSNEIYGENRGDVELFGEDYCGYIDCNTLRAGYPESKRCGEALCQAYRKQVGLDVVIARLTRTFGPTILSSDTKAISQFFNNALNGEDVVLKSEGRQHFSYQYVSDTVAGLLTVLLKGGSGEAYNVADVSGDITLRELASLISAAAGKNVVFDLPDATEAAGFSKATKARLDGAKLRALGWRPAFGIEAAVRRNYHILNQIRGK